MTLKHLKVFITVCECGSMTKAAKKLFIAQPSVSLTISEIEKYYNIKLFDRENNLLYNYKESPGINPKDIIDKEFKRKWVKEELNDYKKDWENLLKMLEKREATISEVEPIRITMNKIIKNIKTQEIKRREIPKKEKNNKKTKKEIMP